MDEIDKKLYNDLNLKIDIPDKLETIIKQGLNKRPPHYSISKIAIGICTFLATTAGIVYAGTIIYDKIWKEPEKVVGFYSEERSKQNTISNEESKSAMSEEEARKKTEKILEKFGYKDEKIQSIQLQNNPDDYESSWYIQTENNIHISFEASNGKSFNISINNVLYENIENYRTTEKNAEETARSLCSKYGYNLNEYSYVKTTSNMNSEKDSYIWNVEFYKEYDGIVNRYEGIGVSFIPQINKLYGFSVNDKKFENNPVEITEEQAKEIALKEEKNVPVKYEINNIDIKLKIIEMNGIAYLRVNDYDQLHKQTSSIDYPSEEWTYYRTDNRVRKAWVVKFNYNIPNKPGEFYNINDRQFSYYIDATTGEIIGGSCI